MAMRVCCFVHLTSWGANSFERSQIRIDMRTDIEDVRSSGNTGSDRPAVKATLLTHMYGPAARCKRFSSSCRFAVLHQCIRPLIGAFAPGHHGYHRACVLISRQASSGAIRVTSVRMRREDRSSISSYSSLRPRLETVDRVMSSLAPHFAQFLCSSQGPFLRPDLQNVDRAALRGGQRRPSRLACGWP